MLVQECDISQGGKVNSAMDIGANEDSERLSQNSLNQNFNYFKGQLQRKQVMNSSVDTTPLTKTYSLKNKTSFISKVNMKSFLLNNGQ